MDEENSKFTENEKLLIKIVSTSNKIYLLFDLTRIPNVDLKIAATALHYLIMELKTFCEAISEFELLVDDDKRQKFSVIKPIISWLNEYKEGCRIYRNKRVAHMDKLDTTTSKLFVEYDLPTTKKEINRINYVIEFLCEYIEIMYIGELEESVKKLGELDSPKTKDNPSINERGLRLMTAISQTMKNSEDPSLDKALSDVCIKRFGPLNKFDF